MRKIKKRNSKNKRSVRSLPVIRPNVAGIDLGARVHYVAGPAPADGSMNVASFGTTTPQLQQLVDWLLEQNVESVAMESTSVYWIPVYDLLESHGIEVLLVNSKQISHVPGRKTDVLDCQWIQLLHSCGLLSGSFRPDEAICALRVLKRQWSNLVEERTKAVQWMQKALDQMNIQVHHAVSDITGKTGMAIVRAIISGERSPSVLAENRDKRCKKSVQEIAEHLTGNWREEHLFNLENALHLYDQLQEMTLSYETKILAEIERLQPPERKEEEVPAHPNSKKEMYMQSRGDQDVRKALYRLSGVDLTRIDGISSEAALLVITEVGLDLSSFPTEKHFVSWLRLAPKYGITGGKQIKGKKNGTGSTRCANVFRMAALSLSRSRTALGAYYRRIARHKGGAVAVFATARRVATLVFRMLRFGQDYVDIGETAFEAQFQKRRLAGLKYSASLLGYILVPVEDAVEVSG